MKKNKLPIPTDKLIFREIWIGGVSKDDLLQNLEKYHIGINEFGLKIISHNDFTTSPDRQKLQTVEISVGDLGFTNGATIKEIYQKADDFGLNLCPPELGPHMRLQYLDPNQPIDPDKGNWQTIAMKEFSDDVDFPKGFYLRRREDGFWLRGYRTSSDFLWDPTDRFIFIIK